MWTGAHKRKWNGNDTTFNSKGETHACIPLQIFSESVGTLPQKKCAEEQNVFYLGRIDWGL